MRTVIRRSDDPDYNRMMRKKLKASNGFCPDAIEHTPDMRCPCKAFLEQEQGWCNMGYMIKEIVEDEDEWGIPRER